MPALWDRDEHLYDNERDLVALAPDDHDRLNMMLKDFFGFLFKVRRSRNRAVAMPAKLSVTDLKRRVVAKRNALTGKVCSISRSTGFSMLA